MFVWRRDKVAKKLLHKRPGEVEQGPQLPWRPRPQPKNLKLVHHSVMKQNCVALLLGGMGPEDGQQRLIVDATFGHGGHSEAILKATTTPRVGEAWRENQRKIKDALALLPPKPTGWCNVVALDMDPKANTIARMLRNKRFAKRRFHLQRGMFGNMRHHLQEAMTKLELDKDDQPGCAMDGPVDGSVDGILLDLGLSARQRDDERRGFRIRGDGPLDMRMDASEGGGHANAADIVNEHSEESLSRLLLLLGEEQSAATIAQGIVAHRENSGRIETTRELSNVICRAKGADPSLEHSHANSVKTFLALRRSVNSEIEEIAKAVRQAERLLRPGGRLLVITSSALESRVINHFLLKRGLPAVSTGDVIELSGDNVDEGLWLRTHDAPNAGFADTCMPMPSEVQANPQCRNTVLWCLTRGEAPVDVEQWDLELQSLAVDEILDVAPAPHHLI